MPYVTRDARVRLDEDAPATNAGELNYCLTWHLLHTEFAALPAAIENEVERFLRFKRKTEGPRNNYQDYNDVLGALTGAELEYTRRRGRETTDDLSREFTVWCFVKGFYRDVVAPYEDVKIQQNGDVYT